MTDTTEHQEYDYGVVSVLTAGMRALNDGKDSVLLDDPDSSLLSTLESTLVPAFTTPSSTPNSDYVEDNSPPQSPSRPESMLVEQSENTKENVDSFYAQSAKSGPLSAESAVVSGNALASSSRSSVLVSGFDTPISGPVSDFVAEDETL